MNNILSFIISTMGRIDHVKQALESVLKQPDAEVVLVDWSCPNQTGDWAENTFKDKYPNLKVVRVPDKTHFHLSAARNVGAKAATGQWFCFLDCDMILADNFMAIIKPLLDELQGDSFLAFEDGGLGYSGTIICLAEDFFRIGQYDENFEGYGYEDIDMITRLRNNLTYFGIKNSLATHIAHGNDKRVENYENRNIQENNAKNLSYFNKKNGKRESPDTPLSQTYDKAHLGDWNIRCGFTGTITLKDDQVCILNGKEGKWGSDNTKIIIHVDDKKMNLKKCGYGFSDNDALMIPVSKIIQPIESNFSMKIPKVIHRIWLGGRMPAIFYKHGHSLEEHLKGWKFVLWTDKNVEYDEWEVRQIQTLMPFRNDYVYRKALTNSARINILKTEILYRFGGVYVDCIFECLKNFESIIGGLDAFIELDNENYSVNNSIMGCTQGHPWMRHIIDQIPKERNDILQQGLRLIEKVSLCHDVALFDSCTFHTPYPTKPVTHANESSRNEHLFLELKEKDVHYEVFILTQTHRQDMARRMVKSLIDNAAEKPSRILVASMEDISDNWGPGVEIWTGANRIEAELLNAGLSKEAFNRIAGNGSEAGIRSKWNLGNGHMFLKYAIPRLCMGKRVLVSDDDVIFRGPCSELFTSGSDMVFMNDPPGFYGGESIRLFLENCWSNEAPEGPFVCAGFYLMNKKQATPEMVNKVILNAKNHRDEQSAVGMEATMGTIHVLQPPKYIHGGQVCDRRIEAKSDSWMKDAEVIHMQGHLDYLRDLDIKPFKKRKAMFVTEAFFGIRNDRPTNYYSDPLNYFTDKMHSNNYMMVFTNRPELIIKRENVDIMVCEPEDLIRDIWAGENWLPQYLDLASKDTVYHDAIQAKSRVILVWNSKIAAIFRASKYTENIVWIDAGRHISWHCNHDITKFRKNELRVPDYSFEDRIAKALTINPIIMHGAQYNIQHMPLLGNRMKPYLHQLCPNSDCGIFYSADFIAMRSKIVEDIIPKFKYWWERLLKDGCAGTEECIFTILSWERKDFLPMTTEEITGFLSI